MGWRCRVGAAVRAMVGDGDPSGLMGDEVEIL